jgi:hypothetical protein
MAAEQAAAREARLAAQRSAPQYRPGVTDAPDGAQQGTPADEAAAPNDESVGDRSAATGEAVGTATADA